MLLAVADSLGLRLAVCGVSVLVGLWFIFVGRQNIRTQTAEESGKRRAVLKLIRKSATYEGKSAVAVGIMRVVLGVAAIIFGIIYIFVGPFLAPEQPEQPNRSLQASITHHVEKGDGTILDLAMFSAPSWERLHIFGPYTELDTVRDNLGFNWAEAESTGIHVLDTFTLLVFVSGDELVTFVEHPRNQGDFSYLYRPGGYSRDEAVFVVREEDHGEPWLVIRRAERDGPD